MKTIKWHIEDDIGFLVLNQPPRNTLNNQFFNEFKWWYNNILPESEIKGIIIHGNGRHFSSGSDVNELISLINSKEDIAANNLLQDNSLLFDNIKKIKIPVIAAIRGVCLGSGLELALSCDIRICSEKGVLGLPEVLFEIIPGCGGTQLMTQLAGRKTAMELILSGQNFTPQYALENNLVDLVVPLNEVIDKAREVIQNLENSSFTNLKSTIKENE